MLHVWFLVQVCIPKTLKRPWSALHWSVTTIHTNLIMNSTPSGQDFSTTKKNWCLFVLTLWWVSVKNKFISLYMPFYILLVLMLVVYQCSNQYIKKLVQLTYLQHGFSLYSESSLTSALHTRDVGNERGEG